MKISSIIMYTLYCIIDLYSFVRVNGLTNKLIRIRLIWDQAFANPDVKHAFRSQYQWLDQLLYRLKTTILVSSKD